jgi:3'-5' exonuclease
MLDKIPLRSILFLDVETVPLVADFNNLPENLQNLWLRKS